MSEQNKAGNEPIAWVVFTSQGHYITENKTEALSRRGSMPLYSDPPDLQAQLDAVREECAAQCEARAKEHVNRATDDESGTDRKAEAWMMLQCAAAIRSRIGEPSPLAQLQAENARLLAANRDCINWFDDAKAEINRLQAENAELRKDAQRYRWLRNPSTDVALVIDKVTGEVEADAFGCGGYKTYEYRSEEELDSAIDAAIAAQEGDNGGVR